MPPDGETHSRQLRDGPPGDARQRLLTAQRVARQVAHHRPVVAEVEDFGQREDVLHEGHRQPLGGRGSPLIVADDDGRVVREIDAIVRVDASVRKQPGCDDRAGAQEAPDGGLVEWDRGEEALSGGC